MWFNMVILARFKITWLLLSSVSIYCSYILHKLQCFKTRFYVKDISHLCLHEFQWRDEQQTQLGFGPQCVEITYCPGSQRCTLPPCCYGNSTPSVGTCLWISFGKEREPQKCRMTWSRSVIRKGYATLLLMTLCTAYLWSWKQYVAIERTVGY